LMRPRTKRPSLTTPKTSSAAPATGEHSAAGGSRSAAVDAEARVDMAAAPSASALSETAASEEAPKALSRKQRMAQLKKKREEEAFDAQFQKDIAAARASAQGQAASTVQ
jgi:hypothetical protein